MGTVSQPLLDIVTIDGKMNSELRLCSNLKSHVVQTFRTLVLFVFGQFVLCANSLRLGTPAYVIDKSWDFKPKAERKDVLIRYIQVVGL